MTDQIITDLTELTTLATGDTFHIVDVSDTTDNAGGSSKKTLLSTIASYLASLSQTLTNKTITSPLGLLKADVGLSNVDNTSDATKNAAEVTLALKTLTTPVVASFYQDAGKTKLMTTPDTASDTLCAIAATQTLTNKKITPRVVTTTDDATSVINVDTTDIYELSAVANATEFTLSGTPTDGQKLIIRLKDAGAGKGLTWTGFTAIGVTLPTTTVASKWHIVGCIYNSAASQWQAVAVVAEA